MFLWHFLYTLKSRKQNLYQQWQNNDKKKLNERIVRNLFTAATKDISVNVYVSIVYYDQFYSDVINEPFKSLYLEAFLPPKIPDYFFDR